MEKKNLFSKKKKNLLILISFNVTVRRLLFFLNEYFQFQKVNPVIPAKRITDGTGELSLKLI